MIIDLNQKDPLSLCPCYSPCIVCKQTQNRLKSPHSLPGVQSKIVREIPPFKWISVSLSATTINGKVAWSITPQSTFRVVHPLPIIGTICINSSLTFHLLYLIFNIIYYYTFYTIPQRVCNTYNVFVFLHIPPLYRHSHTEEIPKSWTRQYSSTKREYIISPRC